MKKKHLVMTLSALLIAGALGACENTVHGAGEDIENAGESIQHNVPPKN
jgi:predicted small secreted protein